MRGKCAGGAWKVASQLISVPSGKIKVDCRGSFSPEMTTCPIPVSGFPRSNCSAGGNFLPGNTAAGGEVIAADRWIGTDG